MLVKRLSLSDFYLAFYMPKQKFHYNSIVKKCALSRGAFNNAKKTYMPFLQLSNNSFLTCFTFLSINLCKISVYYQ